MMLRRRWARRRAAAVLAAIAATLTATGARAQQPDPYRILPPIRYFESPFADPIEPRMSIGLLTTDVLAARGGERDPFFLADQDDADFDVQAAAAVGGTVPLLRLSSGPHGGVIFSGQAGVFARFRIEYPSRDDLGQDWIVAGAFEMKHDNASGRVRISHRSSHLGDEFVNASGADRIEFGGEALDALAAYTFPGIIRVYGGGSWIFRSYTEEQVLALVRIGRQDRFLVQLGADGEWRPWGNVGFSGGLDWQTAERTGWKNALAIAGGLTVDANNRSLSLVARWFDGVSSLGEFFLTPETFWSLELLAEF